MVIRSSVDNILIATNGTKGQPGPAGTSSYIHIKYSNDGGRTFTDNDGETIGAYIGIYRDFTEDDSSKVTDYKWKKIEGEDGADAYTVMLSNENFTISTDTNYVPIHTQTFRCNIVVLKGADPADFTITAAADTENDIVTTISGHTVTIKVATVEALTEPQGTIALTINVDNQSFTKDITWTVATQGVDGQTGVSITGVTNYYLATLADSGVTKETPGWTTEIQNMTEHDPYLWNYEVITGSNGQVISSTEPVIIGRYGRDGEAAAEGRGIYSIVEHYQVSSSNTEPPTTWSDVPIPTDEVNKYLWNYETITYTDNTSEDTQKRVIGTQGETGLTGATGRGVSSITEYFLLSDTDDFSKIVFPEETDKHGWTTIGEALIWSKNKPYLWHCTEIIYENPSETIYTDKYCDTSWKAADLVQANLTSFQQGVDNVIDRDNQSIRSAVWENTYTYKPKKDAEGNYVYDDDGKIVPDEDSKTTMSEYMAESIVDRDGIRTKVEEAESSIDGLERKSSEIEQTADKINWVVKSGSSESNVTLTDSAINAVTNQFIIKDPQGNATIIEGGKINANAITADMITANNLVGDHGWINLKDGKFYYGDDSTFETSDNAISWNGSKLQIKADEFLLASGKSIFDEIDAIETWFYAEAPTTSNEPAKNWTTDNLKEMHLRDVYFDTNTGKSYRWAKDGTTYKWVEIEDKELAAVEGRIASAETQITANKTAIEARATKTEIANTYATKDSVPKNVSDLSDADNYATKKYADDAAGTAETNAKNDTTERLKSYYTTTQTDAKISETAEGITSTVNKIEKKMAGNYATSATGAGTKTKVATIIPAVTGWELYEGASITVKFTNANTNTAPNLNVNSTGAKPIKSYNGNALTENEYKWIAGSTMTFVYDGTNWRIQDSAELIRLNTAETNISQNATDIELRATKTELTNAISQEVKDRDAAIQLSAEGVTSTVSKTYETKTDASAKLTEAKNDATSKANAAEKNAKDDTTEKLKSYYTATQTDSQIEQKADEIATRVSEEKIEGIEIGGRNLAVNSAGNEWYTVTIADGTNKPLNVFGSPSKGYLIIPEISNIKKDDIIQVSFEIKFGENWKETGTGTKASLITGNYNVGGTWASITFQGGNLSKKLPEVMASESREGHLNTYFTVTENMLNGTYTGVALSNIRFDYYSGDVSIRRVMVEKATKPSNWTPAPEDLESYADAAVSSATTEIKQTTDSITARVAANEIKIAGQYATSSTAADTKAKVATIIPSISDWELYTGATVTVKFTKANTDATPTLNINNTGAKPIKNYGGSNLTKNEYEWPAGTTMAFVYDGTNWRVQDSTVMANIKNAETQISQNAEAISLRATKEEAAQMAQPNLAPFFSMPMDESSDDYWNLLSTSRFTQLTDGWAHFEYDNTEGTDTANNYVRPRVMGDLKPGGKYTLLIEFRDVNIVGTKTGTFLYSQQTDLTQVWGITSTGGFTISIDDMRNLSDNKGSFWKSITLLDAESKDPNGTVRGTLPKAIFIAINQYVLAGMSVSYDFRISLYEGEYSGPYKPYIGNLQYTTQAELKVAADSIVSSVTSVGAIVNMLPSVYYRENISGNVYEQNGITWTLNPDGSVTATGTATANSAYYFSGFKITADEVVPAITIDPERTYIVHGCPAGGSDNTYSLRARWTLATAVPSGSSGKVTYDYGDGTVLSPNDGRKYLAVWAHIKSGFTCPDGGLTFYPMVEAGTIKHGYVSNHIGATAQKLYSTIEQLPDKIESTVSSKYETKTDASAKLTEAKNDATSKANAAEKNAKDDTTNKLKSYYTKTETETKITQDATSIATTVSTQKIAELEIGGRNLFIGTTMSDYNHIINSSITDFTKHFRYYNGNAQIHNFEEISSGIYQDTFTLNAKNLGIAFVRLASEIDLDHDSYYTISCMAKCSSTDKPLCIGKSYYTTENKWVWRGGTNPAKFTAADTWQKFTLTFKPDADTQAICYCFTASGEEGGTDTLTIKNCKLEKGTKATAWTPAPEDGIAYTDTVVESAKSEIKQTTDAITASVADIEIGGANLLYNSHDMSKWLKSAECDVENNILHIATSQDTARYADTWVIPKYEDVKGRSITISMDVKKTADTPIDGLYIYTVSTGNEYDPTRTATLAIGKFLYTKFDAFKNIEGVNENTWTRVYVTYDTFDFAESTTTLYDYVGLRVGLRKITGTREAWFRNIKLEYGNRPTSYSSSSEDILRTMRTEMTETADGITTTITHVSEDLSDTKDAITAASKDINDTNDRIDDIDTTLNGDGTDANPGLTNQVATLTTTVNSVDYSFTNLNTNITNYFSFGSDGVLTLGKNGSDGGDASPFKTELSNEKISFKQDGTEIAYMSGNVLHISDAEIMTTLRIGNFIFVPRTNGNMSLKYSPLSQEGE